MSSFSAGLVAAAYTTAWCVRRFRRRGCFVVPADSVVPVFWSCCWGAVLVWGISCSAWRWLVISAVAPLLPIGIGTCGSCAMFPSLGLSVVVLSVAAGFGHGRSRYKLFVYF